LIDFILVASFVAFFIHPMHQRGYFNPGGGRIITMYPLLTFQIVFGNGLQDPISKIWETCSIS
jgi:hypothetical protein